MSKPELKQFPVFKTDEEAEHFVDTADLSEYDFSGFVPWDVAFGEQPGELPVRLPGELVRAAKAKAVARGVSYECFIREAIERAVAG